MANCILLLQAGHETTQDLLEQRRCCSASRISWRCCGSQPELTKNAVEEFLRFDGSVQINHRVALDGLHVNGHEIPAGRCSCFSAP